MIQGNNRMRPSPITGKVYVSAEDLATVYTGMEPGWYRTAQLYPRYREWAEREGRELVSPQKLASSLQWGLGLVVERGKSTKYYVSDRAISGRAWFKES